MKGLCEAYLLVSVLVAILQAVNADPKTLAGATTGTPSHHKEVRYEYRYAVDDPESGVVSARWEHRLGEYVKGAYSLLEPDGKVRTVDYEVDGPRGFHAVIRTSPPANSLLSSEQLSKSRQAHKNPPVNVLTNRPTETSQRSGRVLPINFHSVKPDYYLAFAKGEPANYQDSQPALEAPAVGPAPASGPGSSHSTNPGTLLARDSFPSAYSSTHDTNPAYARHSAPASHAAHKSHSAHSEHILPSVQGITSGHGSHQSHGGGPSSSTSFSNVRTFYPGRSGDVSIPSLPSSHILPPTENGAGYPLHTQVIFTPYASDYFGG